MLYIIIAVAIVAFLFVLCFIYTDSYRWQNSRSEFKKPSYCGGYCQNTADKLHPPDAKILSLRS